MASRTRSSHSGSYSKVAERGRWSTEKAMRMYVNQALADLATDSASIAWAGKLGLPKLLHLWSTEGGYWNGLQCKLERSVELICIFEDAGGHFETLQTV